LAIIEGTDVHGDLWLWEDGDEKWAKALHDTYHTENANPYTIQMPQRDMLDACRALEARTRKSRPPARNVLIHLSPEARVAIIAWLILAGPSRQITLKNGYHRMLKLTTLLGEWAAMFPKRIPRFSTDDCPRCDGSSIFIWTEILLQLYSAEDLMGTSWPCVCRRLQRCDRFLRLAHM
jgi:hypothetical protein